MELLDSESLSNRLNPTTAFANLAQQLQKGFHAVCPVIATTGSDDYSDTICVQPLIDFAYRDNDGKVVHRRKMSFSVRRQRISHGGFTLSMPITKGTFGWVIAPDYDTSKLFNEEGLSRFAVVNDRSSKESLEQYIEIPPTGLAHIFENGVFIPDNFAERNIGEIHDVIPPEIESDSGADDDDDESSEDQDANTLYVGNSIPLGNHDISGTPFKRGTMSFLKMKDGEITISVSSGYYNPDTYKYSYKDDDSGDYEDAMSDESEDSVGETDEDDETETEKAVKAAEKERLKERDEERAKEDETLVKGNYKFSYIRIKGNKFDCQRKNLECEKVKETVEGSSEERELYLYTEKSSRMRLDDKHPLSFSVRSCEYELEGDDKKIYRRLNERELRRSEGAQIQFRECKYDYIEDYSGKIVTQGADGEIVGSTRVRFDDALRTTCDIWKLTLDADAFDFSSKKGYVDRDTITEENKFDLVPQMNPHIGYSNHSESSARLGKDSAEMRYDESYWERYSDTGGRLESIYKTGRSVEIDGIRKIASLKMNYYENAQQHIKMGEEGDYYDDNTDNSIVFDGKNLTCDSLTLYAGTIDLDVGKINSSAMSNALRGYDIYFTNGVSCPGTKYK